jgi:rubrerythrin
MSLNSAEGILDFAIEKEQDAVDFYTELAGKVAAQHMRDLLRSFAKEEQRHIEFIQAQLNALDAKEAGKGTAQKPAPKLDETKFFANRAD